MERDFPATTDDQFIDSLSEGSPALSAVNSVLHVSEQAPRPLLILERTSSLPVALMKLFSERSVIVFMLLSTTFSQIILMTKYLLTVLFDYR